MIHRSRSYTCSWEPRNYISIIGCWRVSREIIKQLSWPRVENLNRFLITVDSGESGAKLVANYFQETDLSQIMAIKMSVISIIIISINYSSVIDCLMKKHAEVSHAKCANIIKVQKFYMHLIHFLLLFFDRIYTRYKN